MGLPLMLRVRRRGKVVVSEQEEEEEEAGVEAVRLSMWEQGMGE